MAIFKDRVKDVFPVVPGHVENILRFFSELKAAHIVMPPELSTLMKKADISCGELVKLLGIASLFERTGPCPTELPRR
ncbi:MAG: hypothetical protein MUQ00_14535 [Candidatus Aminicenantes bacterium]|nr:hypothetical protein [Candidatus Aminicenantes bacterium]